MGPIATSWAWVKRTANLILPRGRFARSVSILAGGTALGQALTVLVSPILTRLYSPEDFGIFGVYASLLGIIVVIASLRYEYAIPLAEKDDTAANILALCFGLLLGMTVLSWFVIQGLGSQIVTWANVPGLEPYLWLIPLGVLGAGAYQILNYWAIRKRDFTRISRTRISRGVGRAAIQVGVGFASAGPLGLLLGQLAGETAGSASLGLAAWRKDRAAFKAVSLQGIQRAGSRYKRFPAFVSGASLINIVGTQAPQILLAAFYGAQVAGWFALGQRVIAAPLNIVVDSVAQVYFGEAAQISRDDPKAVRRLFLRLTSRLALFGGLPVVVICTLAPWFFASVFGPSWERAGQYVQILGFAFAVRLSVTPTASTLNILDRQDLYLIQDSLRLVLILAVFWLSKLLHYSDLTAVTLYSLAMSISTVFFWWLVWRTIDSKCRNKEQGGEPK